MMKVCDLCGERKSVSPITSLVYICDSCLDIPMGGEWTAKKHKEKEDARRDRTRRYAI